MPRLKKTITIDIPASAMSVFEALVADEGYELVENPVLGVVAMDDDDADYDEEEDGDE